ncbi:FGGY-family carbohydrate kinase [Pasteurella skyensis]|uniref:FGGY-family carbohydrate kinase n=1 Tax=Phocoenobacter skyensis TaxID=97481 RepID=A0AAJ6N9Q5_9PAST|nr:FGGY-family carbohydrate kinase [Pasteurella skyensis]MDP8162593.1 FGGY-family carbohydrate kinase [Pasteurella skyensis]MDP8172809.1 FGGY-family carbohydrate kinase [Pasteurella skyensis]MDP8177347.1 FGGY-family carbohydrate kinase [Pasteurella skyensis]MDP8179274.1 FGGY-family carbohydrate kinase [Pasteurella skyensis]MDP8183479.1 FGGY-family carbohydrate kinase [Pasteurella skyensis]
MSYYLGIDCGGTFIKASLFDENLNMYSCVRENVAVLSEKEGYAERDMVSLWESCANVIKQVINTSQIDSTKIKGVGISAQGKGAFLLDKHNQPLGRAILSSDQRALDIVKQWQKEGIPQQLYPITRQTLWTGHPVSVLRWIKENEPKRYHQIGSLLMSHDYLRFCLTDQLYCEETNISESNLYNMNTGTYDPELAQLLGIPEIINVLPPIIGSNQPAGTVTEKASQQTGLAVGTPVVGGLFDVVSTALCANLNDETTLNVVLGTWSVVSGITSHIDNSQSLPFVYGRYADHQSFIVHEASPTSAGNLEWFTQQWSNLSYEDINAGIATLAPASSSVLFIPFLYGSNAGLGMKAGFYGIQSYHTQFHLLQSIYEGVLFSLMHHLEKMLQRFPNVAVLRVTGGPTKSDIWMQMLADLTGITLEIPQIEETGCLGAAVMAMQQGSCLKSIVSELKIVKPNLDNLDNYQQKYQQYKELVKQLQGLNK